MSGDPINVEPLKLAATEAVGFTRMIAYLLAFRVVDQGSAAQAASAIQYLAAQLNAFKAKRNEGLKHARALLKWAESLFPLTTIKSIDEVIDHLKQQVHLYLEQQRALQAAALTEARSQAEVQQAVYVLSPEVPQGLVEVESWTWAVVDIMSIPRDYWVLDKQRLDAEAQERKSALSIPGIQAVRNTSLRRSGR